MKRSIALSQRHSSLERVRLESKFHTSSNAYELGYGCGEDESKQNQRRERGQLGG